MKCYYELMTYSEYAKFRAKFGIYVSMTNSHNPKNTEYLIGLMFGTEADLNSYADEVYVSYDKNMNGWTHSEATGMFPTREEAADNLKAVLISYGYRFITIEQGLKLLNMQ